MTNKYVELKERHQQEVNNFPMQFAFSDQQFKEGMEKLGLTEHDTDKVYSIGGGGFIRKTDSVAYNEMFKRFDKEIQEAIDNDINGEGYIYEMFNYELANHEYGYTFELEQTLDALGLTYEQVKADKKLMHGLQKAIKNFK